MTTEWIVEAFDELNDGAFTASTTSDESDCVATFHCNVDTAQDRNVGSGWIVEMYLLQIYVTVHH